MSFQRQSLDEELPQFDPNSFKPGYVPPMVKKGDEEYAIIVSGVKDTGLCGKYWSDMDHLPRRRKYEYSMIVMSSLSVVMIILVI